MEVDEAVPKDSEMKSEEEVELVTEEELAMEIAIREEFIQNLANKAMISQDHIQELYKKYVKRPRKYKDYEVSKSAATHLALAAKHFVAHVLQMGLQHHLSKKPDEFTVDYDDMADAVASDPRMKKLQGMLPRRITAAEALKLRAMKLKHTQKAANRDMAEILTAGLRNNSVDRTIL